jgi:hypothetical protein
VTQNLQALILKALSKPYKMNNKPRIAKTITLAKMARVVREEKEDHTAEDYKISNTKYAAFKKNRSNTKPADPIVEKSICYCKDEECDWGCGVQSCGGCIDVCRCDRWFR